MPRWIYRRITRTSGDPNPVMIQGDVARQGGKQLAEYMLCRTCETMISRWENYAASIALQPNGTFPARMAARQVDGWNDDEMAVADASALDVAQLVRFGASVVWRASASRTMEKVDLGPTHSERIAAFLLGSETAPLPDTAFLLVELISPDDDLPIDEVIIPPYGGMNDEIFLQYRFALFGMVFYLIAGNLVPRGFDAACLARTGRVILSDGRRLLPDIAEMFGKALANGGLRRGRRAERKR